MRGGIGIELIDQSRTMREHSALVDAAFVGDFAFVDVGRLGEDKGSGDAAG